MNTLEREGAGQRKGGERGKKEYTCRWSRVDLPTPASPHSSMLNSGVPACCGGGIGDT